MVRTGLLHSLTSWIEINKEMTYKPPAGLACPKRNLWLSLFMHRLERKEIVLVAMATVERSNREWMSPSFFKLTD